MKATKVLAVFLLAASPARADVLGFGDGDAPLPPSVERHRALARRMFWTGLGGMAVANACNSAQFVPGRTAGIAVWGVGWTLWVGFAALADAELLEQTSKVGLSLDLVPGPHPRGSLVWRVAEF